MIVVHDWCGRVDDPTGDRCPCKANRTTESEAVSTAKAIRRAKASGWAGNATNHPKPRVIGEHFGRSRAA